MRPLKILHVEDKEEDVSLFSRACEAEGLAADCYAVRDGSKAVAYLEGQGKFADRHAFPPPDLIALDINMPGMDGFDFLKCCGKRRISCYYLCWCLHARPTRSIKSVQ